jgi:alpha-ketoglutarate-dependent taurine dioxygenase
MDTTRAYEDLSEQLKQRCEGVVGHFAYSPEIWAEGLPDWQLQHMTGGKRFSYKMPLVNTSERGKKGLYFHFLNECSFPSDPDLLPILKEHCFKDKYIQTVDWREGDIHLSHQILTLHRREQNDPQILANRVLNRYGFDFRKVFPDSKPLYVK